MIVVDCILLSLMSYIFGFDICIVILSFGLAGVFFGILILGLLGLLVFFIFLIIISIACKRFFISKKACDNNSNSFYVRIYMLLLALSTALLFLLSLLFSIIHIFVIVD
jgi:hypothetical protein